MRMSIRMKMSNFVPTYNPFVCVHRHTRSTNVHCSVCFVLLMILLHSTISCSRQMALVYFVLCRLYRVQHCVLWAVCFVVLWSYTHIWSCSCCCCCCYFRARYYCSLLKILVVLYLKYTSNHIFECSAVGIQQFCSSFDSLVLTLDAFCVCTLRFSDHSFSFTIRFE